MKIVYCIDSISGFGGIQKITVLKAGLLADIPGNEVWIIRADSSGTVQFYISPKVKVIDLHIDYYADDWKSKWHVLKGIFIKRRLHKARLKTHLRAIAPDIVISVGQSEKNILPRIKGQWKSIREYHFQRKYRILHATGPFNKVLAWAGDLYERLFSLKLYDRIVLLTEEDKRLNWQGNNKVTVIPNPISVNSSGKPNLQIHRVISVGRLTKPKNYPSLVRAFAIVVRKHPDWVLDIFGSGNEEGIIKKEISLNGLENKVRLQGASGKVEEEMRNASIFAMTSVYEGLPLVLLEAISCGMPVTAYACPCGPKDIITDGKDGFLVPIGDEKLLAEKICRLIEDEPLRQQIGQAALLRSQDFAPGLIIDKWMDLFLSLTSDVRPA